MLRVGLLWIGARRRGVRKIIRCERGDRGVCVGYGRSLIQSLKGSVWEIYTGNLFESSEGFLRKLKVSYPYICLSIQSSSSPFNLLSLSSHVRCNTKQSPYYTKCGAPPPLSHLSSQMLPLRTSTNQSIIHYYLAHLFHHAVIIPSSCTMSTDTNHILLCLITHPTHLLTYLLTYLVN